MPMSLLQWLSNGWLSRHRSSPEEIRDLLNIIDRDLRDSQTPGLSNDWRFNIAYNAALQCATAALAACGYRATRDGHHYRTILSLELSMGVDHKTVRQMDIFRKKRNVTGYDMAGYISDQESQAVIDMAVNLKSRLKQWLKENHRDLLPD